MKRAHQKVILSALYGKINHKIAKKQLKLFMDAPYIDLVLISIVIYNSGIPAPLCILTNGWGSHEVKLRDQTMS